MTDDMPIPAWKPTRRPARVRKQLSRDAIVDAALRLLDRDGLDGVSMRRVAEELGTGPASLYAHVANKDELLELLHDRVVGEVEVPAPDPATWQRQLRDVALASFRAFQAHRDIARVSLANVPTGPNALRMAVGMFAIMLAGGVPAQVAAWALDRLALYVAADAYEGTLYQRRLARPDRSLEESVDQYFGSVRDFMLSLPGDRFPLIVKHVDEFMAGTGDERFAFGLDMLIRSLATYVPS